MKDKGQILLYQTPDGESRIEVLQQTERIMQKTDNIKMSE